MYKIRNINESVIKLNFQVHCLPQDSRLAAEYFHLLFFFFSFLKKVLSSVAVRYFFLSN